ncbi:MAG: hypothetical protein ACYCSA_00220 [Thermoplasmataceae archaeon]|jgi:hypothetical protein|nr:hypothetical protein [Candidatus Thermoplasmatota archaeon]
MVQEKKSDNDEKNVDNRATLELKISIPMVGFSEFMDSLSHLKIAGSEILSAGKSLMGKTESGDKKTVKKIEIK